MLSEDMIITPPIFNAFTAYSIATIALFMAIASIIVYSYKNKQHAIIMTIGALVGMGGRAIAALSGFLSRFDFFPPPMLIMIVSVLGVAFAIGLSSFGRILATETSLIALIGLQAFRLPLELVMDYAGSQSIMPVQLSYSGYNYDIFTGIGAIILIVLLVKSNLPKIMVWIWNIWGMLCLVAIMIIAITTSPMVQAFGNEPKDLNTWVLFFPYVWLPVVLVTIAISGHIIITRKLLLVRGVESPS